MKALLAYVPTGWDISTIMAPHNREDSWTTTCRQVAQYFSDIGEYDPGHDSIHILPLTIMRRGIPSTPRAHTYGMLPFREDPWWRNMSPAPTTVPATLMVEESVEVEH